MSAQACAEIVRRGDPDRWRCAMVAAPERRAGLMALYAFNLEVARAPWVGSEPLLAQIRLRWWVEAVGEIYEGGAARRHEVVEALAGAIREGALPRALFEALIEARMADVELAPHPDRAALERYLARTAGGLMELAARHLGAGEAALGPVRDFGLGAGLAAYLQAVPELIARGRRPLPGGDAAETVRALAIAGRAAIARARAARALVPAEAAAALLPGRLAGLVLGRAAADPGRVLRGELGSSEFRSRASLVWRAFSGRW